MKIFLEDELLNEGFRKKVIDEIEGDENLKRKAQMKRRYDVYKDDTKQYVIAMMEESDDQQIVNEIINRVANVSFCRKIINKKAMVYKDGARREVTSGKQKDQDQIDLITDMVKMNSVMKKANRYSELFKNAVVQVMPFLDPVSERFYYQPTVLAPFLYDVIEDGHNPEIARAYITSYFSESIGENTHVGENMSGFRETGEMNTPFRKGDGTDQIIADAPADEGGENKEYVWWSNRFHFTTDKKGKLIPGRQDEGLLNPIGELNFYNFSQEQDGHFWAVGGEDLIDSSILLNMLLSDLFYIAKYQGMGVGYMFGKGVPKNLKVGASSFVTLEVEEGDPPPQIGFATSNPPIQAHLEMLESYIALTLSTNKLDPGTIQAKLGSAAGATSGVHEMIKRAENTDDIQDQREIYRDGEPVLYRIMSKWHNLYLEGDHLTPELAEIGKLSDDVKVKVKFSDPQPFLSEKEKLEIIEKRQELGLDSLIDSIIRDNPELSEDEAMEKLQKTLELKLMESSNSLKLLLKEDQSAKEPTKQGTIEEERQEAPKELPEREEREES